MNKLCQNTKHARAEEKWLQKGTPTRHKKSRESEKKEADREKKVDGAAQQRLNRLAELREKAEARMNLLGVTWWSLGIHFVG